MTAEGLTEAERAEGRLRAHLRDTTGGLGWADVERVIADRLAAVQAERDGLRERVEALADQWDAALNMEEIYKHHAADDLRAALDAGRSTDPS